MKPLHVAARDTVTWWCVYHGRAVGFGVGVGRYVNRLEPASAAAFSVHLMCGYSVGYCDFKRPRNVADKIKPAEAGS